MPKTKGPHKQIDVEALKKLAERHWDTRAIASFFGVSHDTIQRRFASVIEESRQMGKAKVIDLLWQRAAVDKSDRILAHLADRVLGPIPKALEVSGKGGEPFKLILEDYRSKK